MKCFMCEQTDGLVYSSNPIKLKCTVTGKLHNVTDSCDCCCDRDYSRMNYDLFRSMSLLALTLAGTNKHKPDCIFFVDEPDMGAHIYDCMMREDFETNITGVKGFSCELCKNYTTASQVKKMLKDKDATEPDSKDETCGKELSKFFHDLWANPQSNKVEDIKQFIVEHCDKCDKHLTPQCELYHGGFFQTATL